MAISMNGQILYTEMKKSLKEKGISVNGLTMQEVIFLYGKDNYYKLSSKFTEVYSSWSNFDDEQIKKSLKEKGYNV